MENWLARQQQRYRQDGFGLWAVVLRSTGEMVGQAGLTWQDCEGRPVLEVGYLLKKRFWRRGYASEAARACRDYAFQTLGAEKVSSIIKTDNLASIRVAQRNGMVREKEFTAHYYNVPVPHYLYTAWKDDMMNTAYCMEQLKALCAIDSPSGFTDRAADYLIKELSRLGWAPERTRKGGGPGVPGRRGPGPAADGPCGHLGGRGADHQGQRPAGALPGGGPAGGKLRGGELPHLHPV